MAYSFIIKDEAIKELTEAVLWYEEQQLDLGKEFRNKVYAKLGQVCNNPFYFRITNKKFREAFAKKSFKKS